MLNYVHFQHFLPRLINVLKKKGYDPDVPFSELDEEVWELIENPSRCILEPASYLSTSSLKNIKNPFVLH